MEKRMPMIEDYEEPQNNLINPLSLAVQVNSHDLNQLCQVIA